MGKITSIYVYNCPDLSDFQLDLEADLNNDVLILGWDAEAEESVEIGRVWTNEADNWKDIVRSFIRNFSLEESDGTN